MVLIIVNLNTIIKHCRFGNFAGICIALSPDFKICLMRIEIRFMPKDIQDELNLENTIYIAYIKESFIKNNEKEIYINL